MHFKHEECSVKYGRAQHAVKDRSNKRPRQLNELITHRDKGDTSNMPFQIVFFEYLKGS